MSTQTYVLRPDSLRFRDGRATLVVGLPWYRALPWASVADVQVTLDGAPAAVLLVDGSALPDLASREEYWGLQHRTEVVVAVPEMSDPVSVTLHIDLRIPGPTKPDGSPMDYRFETQRDLIAA